MATGGSLQKDSTGKQTAQQITEQVSNPGNKKAGEEIVKRRKTSSRDEPESSTSGDENFTASPTLVSLAPGVRITTVAAGGRHTLVLSGHKKFEAIGRFLMLRKDTCCIIIFTEVSDVGQVWGWGYGGEGQLGLGSRIKMVSTPHLISCFDPAKDRPFAAHQGSMSASAQVSKGAGSYVKGIACGGRHSALITDTGALLTFGWGLYGQCGHGSTNDQLRPSYVSSLTGIQVERIAAGLWHTVCVSVEGRVYAFGGNQFGQLGTGDEQGETVPKLLDSPSLECKRAKVVSCGARHSAMLTEDGQVLSWGWNKYGQLGLGDSIDRNIPSEVPVQGCLPKNVACGWWHTLLLAETPS